MSNLKIALTGGIACGKSSVGEILHKMGAAIIQLDTLARAVVQPNTSGLAALVVAFGKDILNADKTLNRAKLRQYLLTDPAHKKLIEDILHPLIFARMNTQIAQLKNQLIIVEIPLITQANLSNFERVIVVKCSPQKQVERLMRRENIDEKSAKKNIAAQANQDNQDNIIQQIPIDVLENHENIERLTQKTKKLYAKLINL